jgi:uncharacterized protein YdaU (DUF1376 family)
MGKIAWYKRDPRAALDGMMCLSLEERGAYNTVLDLIYTHDGELMDDDAYIARWCGCNVRRWRRLRERLLALGKLFVTNGKLHNGRADKEANEALGRITNATNGGKASKPAQTKFDHSLPNLLPKQSPNLEAVSAKNNGLVEATRARATLTLKKDKTPTSDVESPPSTPTPEFLSRDSEPCTRTPAREAVHPKNLESEGQKRDPRDPAEREANLKAAMFARMKPGAAADLAVRRKVNGWFREYGFNAVAEAHMSATRHETVETYPLWVEREVKHRRDSKGWYDQDKYRDANVAYQIAWGNAV